MPTFQGQIDLEQGWTLDDSVKAAIDRRAREILVDPKVKGKAKMYLEVAKIPEQRAPTKEEPPKAIVPCS